MTDSTLYRYGRPAIVVFVLSMAVLSAVSGYARLEAQGLAALGDVVVNGYIALLVVWGVAVEGFDTDRFRTALYAGLVLWGVVDVAAGAVTPFSVVFLVAGTALLARMAYRRTQN
ncbi:hypothetical protein [Halorubrum sp. CBA1229]|jgi:hypothetical protein|uniref:hypothetical protein n=1 Tax=Halorubrum sp. CBA1229 TaxID=1853699 RepID=UPI000F413846|nr:hypothetical protein [Halorubrum sp. CBA1229]QKY17533.1 hypothetical protein Hrr1229_011785 [Halorubrum sp. CBA1229]